MEAAAKVQRQMVRLRGRSYVAFVFVPTVPILDWLQEIDATIARSPGFFAGRPVVIDLSSVDLSQSGINHLLTSLQDRNIRVLGIEGVEEGRLTPMMPPLLSGGRSCVVEPSAPKKVEKAEAKPTSLLLENPVRSGQTVIFPEGDVTILGSVGSGAEVVAGGSIHVYGALRGRAMAGVNGHTSARIYCQKIEAELLAIDGFYQTADDIDAALRGKPAQAWLQGNTMRITALN
ncbi:MULTISPECIES: septum site-determining protein MinC [Bradyrhizobium]|jgi:septum site-determining protein MinC|uniref:Probable septum site-determining protein MinC n=2 Tax=Bradyrhizobium diazoefficiens TaxID=1355477 RepID=MINC_BRADU|nr:MULTISPECIES: septum site-determining protein MinC [Bradyrhizobium]Q89MI2.1 RecName: Full=Probable septum site-determining protein MinC [Bradyrhizobium diazoefficiens USDA 110]MBP1093176.1 septum site-determining protein MinC [Bradyrhizobium japonicum]AND89504.1 septation inhibitor protein [Bradyrhizobium diazoefficiens USDA 110]APO53722.1 septation inhibitor protein [Bradyrhizobium diazoefficiens]AWO91147.1 septum site-determining protein MinC [Bradyrhizobium diazoefficiens]KGJ69763.1 put